MGNHSVVDFYIFFDMYGINFTGKESTEDLKRIQLAFDSAKDMEEFVNEVKRILNDTEK